MILESKLKLDLDDWRKGFRDISKTNFVGRRRKKVSRWIFKFIYSFTIQVATRMDFVYPMDRIYCANAKDIVCISTDIRFFPWPIDSHHEKVPKRSTLHSIQYCTTIELQIVTQVRRSVSKRRRVFLLCNWNLAPTRNSYFFIILHLCADNSG